MADANVDQRILTNNLTMLVTSIQSCVASVADKCQEKSLIAQAVYEEVQQKTPSTPGDRARTLLLAVRDCMGHNKKCFEEFLGILDTEIIFEDLIRDLREAKEAQSELECKTEQTQLKEGNQEQLSSENLLESDDSKISSDLPSPDHNNTSSGNSSSQVPICNCPPFKCRCSENCGHTLDSFVEGNEEQPREAFPFLNTEGLSNEDREKLVRKLLSEARKMLGIFTDLIVTTFDSLKIQEISVEDLRANTLTFGQDKLPKPYSDGHIQSLETASTVREIQIFLVKHKYVSFFNYEILQKIIEKYGKKEDKKNLNDYLTKYKEFCKRSVFEVPSTVIDKLAPEGGQELVVKVNESQWFSTTRGQERQGTTFTVDDVYAVEESIAEIIGLDSTYILLRDVKKGCVELTFAVVSGAIMFPLLYSQLKQLSNSGINIITDKFSAYAFRTNSVEQSHSEYSQVKMAKRETSSFQHKENLKLHTGTQLQMQFSSDKVEVVDKEQDMNVIELFLSKKYELLRKWQDYVIQQIQTSGDKVIAVLAGKARAKFLISHELNVLAQEDIPPDRKASQIVVAILSKISLDENDAHFDTFVSILHEIPALDRLATYLERLLPNQPPATAQPIIQRARETPKQDKPKHRPKDVPKKKEPDSGVSTIVDNEEPYLVDADVQTSPLAPGISTSTSTTHLIPSEDVSQTPVDSDAPSQTSSTTQTVNTESTISQQPIPSHQPSNSSDHNSQSQQPSDASNSHSELISKPPSPSPSQPHNQDNKFQHLASVTEIDSKSFKHADHFAVEPVKGIQEESTKTSPIDVFFLPEANSEPSHSVNVFGASGSMEQLECPSFTSPGDILSVSVDDTINWEGKTSDLFSDLDESERTTEHVYCEESPFVCPVQESGFTESGYVEVHKTVLEYRSHKHLQMQLLAEVSQLSEIEDKQKRSDVLNERVIETLRQLEHVMNNMKTNEDNLKRIIAKKDHQIETLKKQVAIAEKDTDPKIQAFEFTKKHLSQLLQIESEKNAQINAQKQAFELQTLKVKKLEVQLAEREKETAELSAAYVEKVAELAEHQAEKEAEISHIRTECTKQLEYLVATLKEKDLQKDWAEIELACLHKQLALQELDKAKKLTENLELELKISKLRSDLWEKEQLLLKRDKQVADSEKEPVDLRQLNFSSQLQQKVQQLERQLSEASLNSQASSETSGVVSLTSIPGSSN